MADTCESCGQGSSYDSDDDYDDAPLIAPASGKYGWKKFLKTQKECFLRFLFVGLRSDLYLMEPLQDRYKSLKAKGEIALPQIIQDEYDKKYGSSSLSHVFISLTTLLRIIEETQLYHGKGTTTSTTTTDTTSTTNTTSTDTEPDIYKRGKSKTNRKEKTHRKIQTTEVDFLKKALTIIQPTYAAEPFYVFGMELLCVQDLSSIYSPLLENVSDAFLARDEVNLSQNQIELLAFIAALRKSGRRHFVSTFISSIYSTDEKKFSESYLNLRKKHRAKNKLIRDFCKFMEVAINTEDICNEHFNEMDLSKFLLLLLNDLDFVSDNNTYFIADYCKTQTLTQYQHARKPSTKGQKNTPDLKLVEMPSSDDDDDENLADITKVLKILILKLESPAPSNHHKWKPLMKSHYSSKSECIDLVTFETTLLWQVQEQLVATMMNMDYKNVENEDCVFQGNLVVCNDKVRSVLLALNGNCYNAMYQNVSARETLQWIKKYVLYEKKMWARIYIDAKEYDILDVVLQA